MPVWVVFVSEAESHQAAQAGLDLPILLSLPPLSWEHGPVLRHLASWILSVGTSCQLLAVEDSAPFHWPPCHLPLTSHLDNNLVHHPWDYHNDRNITEGGVKDTWSTSDRTFNSQYDIYQVASPPPPPLSSGHGNTLDRAFTTLGWLHWEQSTANSSRMDSMKEKKVPETDMWLSW